MKQLTGYLFAAAIFAVLALAVFYLSRRSAYVFGTRRIWFYAGYAVTTVASLYFMFAGKDSFTTGWLMHGVCLASSVLVGVLVWLLLSSLATDLVLWGLKQFPKVREGAGFLFSPKGFGLIAGTLTLVLSVVSLAVSAVPRVKEVEVVLPKLKEPVKAVQFSDVHLGHFRGNRHLQRLVDMANGTGADVAFITGDLFESWYNFSPETLDPLRNLKMPVFFVEGNHDGYVDAAAVKEMVRSAGVKVLENETVLWPVPGTSDTLQIIGLDMMNADSRSHNMHASAREETIESTLAQLPLSNAFPTIMLHHCPVGAEYAEKAGVGLYLSGHTHGGQFFPLTYINDAAFKYNRGLYRVGESATQIYVSVGSGTFGPPMRLGTRGEVTLINLVGVK